MQFKIIQFEQYLPVNGPGQTQVAAPTEFNVQYPPLSHGFGVHTSDSNHILIFYFFR